MSDEIRARVAASEASHASRAHAAVVSIVDLYGNLLNAEREEKRLLQAELAKAKQQLALLAPNEPPK